MALILDAMGSDDYPLPEINGALAAAHQLGVEIVLVGKEKLLQPKLSELNKSGLAVSIVNAPDVLEMEDKPVEAARKKPNNSMAVGLQLVRDGKGDVFISAGNTGAVMFNALRILGRIKGVNRPALTALFPVKDGHAVVLDIGANADARPEFLQQFAIMGSLYARIMFGIASPRVALLSNGEEAGKGNQLIKEAYPLLENAGVNFIGNVEGKELFAHQADVVVTDGFTGNILLKSSEAVAKLLVDELRASLMSSTRTKIGGLLARPAFNRLRKMMDPAEVGAAPLLGIDGLVFVGHGRSDARAITSALHAANRAAQSNLLGELRQTLQQQLTQMEKSAAE